MDFEAACTPSIGKTPHIVVCVCTYKRPDMLKRLLVALSSQATGAGFSYSAVVVDNDSERSAEATVEAVRSSSGLAIKYCLEPTRGISAARNCAVANASGDYLAFIDDDEFPIRNWLMLLLESCTRYKVDGVLGPVLRHFDERPPHWLERSNFYVREVVATGTPVIWNEARTGNVLIKRHVFDADPMPFRLEFRVGEDQDFFRRKIEAGYKFVWSSEAEAYESVPPARWSRSYLMKKGLLRGASAALQPSCTARSVLKSVVAIPMYALALPFSLFAGQHKFMMLTVKLCDHIGKLSAVLGFNLIKEAYVSEGSV